MKRKAVSIILILSLCLSIQLVGIWTVETVSANALEESETTEESGIVEETEMMGAEEDTEGSTETDTERNTEEIPEDIPIPGGSEGIEDSTAKESDSEEKPVPFSDEATEPGRLNIADGSIFITTAGYSVGGNEETAYTGEYIITGTSTSNTITILSGSHTITIQDLNISDGCPINFESADRCNLKLEGSNTLRAGSNNPAIKVSDGKKLAIEGNGTLRAYGGDSWPGIGKTGNGNIEINSGIIYAYGGSNASGIGGSWGFPSGTVTINGGTVHATGGNYGAGIGGGNNGKADTITINGGLVTATGGSRGAGIGGGRSHGASGTITISGGKVNASGGGYAAGIGGGYSGSGGTIIITDGTVTAKGGSSLPQPEDIGKGTYGGAWDVKKNGGVINGENYGDSILTVQTNAAEYTYGDEITITGTAFPNKESSVSQVAAFYDGENIAEASVNTANRNYTLSIDTKRIGAKDNAAITVQYVDSDSAAARAMVSVRIVPGDQEVTEVSIDFREEALSTTTEMEYRLTGSAPWYPCSDHMQAAKISWKGEVMAVFIRYAEKKNYNAGAIQTLTIPARPEAPNGKIIVLKSQDSITITNTNDFSDCEFSLGDGKWNNTGKFTGLDAGQEYDVVLRKAATDYSFASYSASTVVRTADADGAEENTEETTEEVTEEITEEAPEEITEEIVEETAEDTSETTAETTTERASKMPYTGDENNIALWVILMGASVLVLCGVMLKLRLKKRKKDE